MVKKSAYLEEYLPINGTKEYMLHFPSAEKNAPVVLYLHGGPGLAASALGKSLSPCCTTVYWDMPGAGKTLTENPGIYPTMDQLLKDLFIVVSCLKIKYWKDQIILLGQGYGNILADLYTRQRPEDVLCCIALTPVIGAVENEASALDAVRETLGSQSASKLKHMGTFPETDSAKMQKKIMTLRRLQRKLYAPKGLIPAMIKSPLCKFSDLCAAEKGLKSNQKLWDFLLWHNLNQENTCFPVPYFMITGSQDLIAPVALAKSYFSRLEAPVKKYTEIPDSGHFIPLDSQNVFSGVLSEILDIVKKDK